MLLVAVRRVVAVGVAQLHEPHAPLDADVRGAGEELEPAGPLTEPRVHVRGVAGLAVATLLGARALHVPVVVERAELTEGPLEERADQLGHDDPEGYHRLERRVRAEDDGVHPRLVAQPLPACAVEVDRLQLEDLAAIFDALFVDGAVGHHERFGHLVAQVEHEAPAGEAQQRVEQRVDLRLDGGHELVGLLTHGRRAAEHLGVRDLLLVLVLHPGGGREAAADEDDGDHEPQGEVVGGQQADSDAGQQAEGAGLVHGSLLDFLFRLLGGRGDKGCCTSYSKKEPICQSENLKNKPNVAQNVESPSRRIRLGVTCASESRRAGPGPGR